MVNRLSACRRSASERHPRWLPRESRSGHGIALPRAGRSLGENCDAAFTVERFKLLALVAEASGRQFELDDVRKVPLIHRPSDLGLTTAHLPQSSSRVPCQSTPFARQVRASRPPLLRMPFSRTGFARPPRSAGPPPFSVGTFLPVTTCKANTGEARRFRIEPGDKPPCWSIGHPLKHAGMPSCSMAMRRQVCSDAHQHLDYPRYPARALSHHSIHARPGSYAAYLCQ
jgi:hypothetical protein